MLCKRKEIKRIFVENSEGNFTPYKALNAIISSAIAAVDPYLAIKKCVSFKDGVLTVDGGASNAADPQAKYLPFQTDLSAGNLYVVGAGKAASRMSLATEEVFGDTIRDGIAVTKYGYAESLKKIRQIEAGHPVPDDKGVQGVTEIAHLLRQTAESDLVVVLISGGGSALLPLPAPGITLADKQAVTSLLLSCGATIQEMNTIRKHLSGIKGGQLARLAAPARVLTFILSEVIGDDPASIASGPTAPDDSTFKNALDIIKAYDLTQKLPKQALNRLEKGAAGKLQETPGHEDTLFNRVFFRFIGSNQIALNAASQKAAALGYHPLILANAVEGEAREIAKFLAAVARQLKTHGQPVPSPACILSGGEPTVTLKGKGKGGRNQELALAAGIEIEGLNDVVIASVGTDGTDGPTDAAGGFADGEMMRIAREKQLNPADFLARNDSYPFLENLGYLIKTGPTGTNVMDIHIILSDKPPVT